ncbi:MAG: HEPN domain-containing protein [Pyrobaculum sp.]
MEALKTRALQFLEQAKFAAERGFAELALFNIEQYVQLYVKYLLYRRVGDFPKTHYVRDLFDRLLAVYGDVCNLKAFAERWRTFMAVLEYVYVASRYLPYRARQEDVDVAMRFVEEFSEVGRCLETS